MSEKVALEPKDIGTFFGVVARYICYTADKDRISVKDMYSQVEGAIALGLLLAEQQPTLVDACTQYWTYTQEISPKDYVDSWLKMYQEFKNVKE